MRDFLNGIYNVNAFERTHQASNKCGQNGWLLDDAMDIHTDYISISKDFPRVFIVFEY